MVESSFQAQTEQDDISFIRTGDHLCLSCIPVAGGHKRMALRAMAFGNRMCFLEDISSDVVCPNIASCVYVLEQALSVRALQERFNQESKQNVQQVSIKILSNTTAQTHSFRTLLYGHAVLLRHLPSTYYLACLSSSTSNDKLAFDVGLRDSPEGEACWFTVHPASKQRSEGEKVRFNDDIILVSVFSERYLHAYMSTKERGRVNASFRQQIWCLMPISSGMTLTKHAGYVFGGDVLRLFHANLDQCICSVMDDNNTACQPSLFIKGGSVCAQASSLWRVEQFKIRWHGGFLEFGNRFRLRQVTTGEFLAVLETENGVCVTTIPHRKATSDAVTFEFCVSKEKQNEEFVESDGIGTPSIKYDETLVFIRHCATNLWLSYDVLEVTVKGVGKVEEKRLTALEEGHMDDCFKLVRAQEEESRSAAMIRICMASLYKYIKFDIQTSNDPDSINNLLNSVDTVDELLNDLNEYFAQPSPSLEHEIRQQMLKALRNRQDLFQDEGMINALISTINFFGEKFDKTLVQETLDSKIENVTDKLYCVLASMIAGNRNNCKHFAQGSRLNWLINRLQSQNASRGVLEVLHNVLVESPEVLNMISESHILAIFGLLDRNGRDPKVLDVLSSLCKNKDVAVRTNQNLICESILPRQDLMLQTILVDQIISVRPNISICIKDADTMYKKWYYEIIIDHIEQVSHSKPVIRIGWATSEFRAIPGIGRSVRSAVVGDDMFSWGFDGADIWFAGQPVHVSKNGTVAELKKNDVIGCLLDLNIPEMWFCLNGRTVRCVIRDFSTSSKFHPVVSMSARVSCRFLLGQSHGRFIYNPSEEFAPVCEAMLPKQKLVIEPCFVFGDLHRNSLSGEFLSPICAGFTPSIIDVNDINVPSYLAVVQEKLSENIHDMWAMNKISSGYKFGEYRDERLKIHPCLTSFDRLPQDAKQHYFVSATDSIRTVLALKYQITLDPKYDEHRNKCIKLNNNYCQINGYKPQPLDLSVIAVNNKHEELIDRLAENNHNIWVSEKIKEGWTYGINENQERKRSPLMLPYTLVDESIKKLNKDTASDLIKSLLAFGCIIESVVDADDVLNATQSTEVKKVFDESFFRVEKSLAVKSGKWYFEAEILSSENIKVGWAKAESMPPMIDLSKEELSVYLFDGSKKMKYHGCEEPFGKHWKPGDVLGSMIDLHDRTIRYSLNGEFLFDEVGSEAAFEWIDDDEGYVPAFVLGPKQKIRVNFGHDALSLKYFSACGLQEGYEPFCVNMTRPVTFWYANKICKFVTITADNSTYEVHRINSSRGNPPCLKVGFKNFGASEKSRNLFLRLSLPVKCYDTLVPRHVSQEKKRIALQELVSTQEERKAFNYMTTDKFASEEHETTGFVEPVLQYNPPAEVTVAENGEKDNVKQTHTRRGKLFNKFSREKPNKAKRRVEDVNANVHRIRNKGVSEDRSRRLLSTTQDEGEMDQENLKLDLETARSLVDYIHEYSFGIRIFPGQDLTNIAVGWTTCAFHPRSMCLDDDCDRVAVIARTDEDGSVIESVMRKGCYLVNVSEIMSSLSPNDKPYQHIGNGVVISSVVDASSGLLFFCVGDVESPLKFQVEPDTALYASVYVKASSKEIIQFEFDRIKQFLPLSSGCFSSLNKDPEPRCPLRLHVQILEDSHWERVPNKLIRFQYLKLGDVRGWSVLCDDAVQNESIYVAEDDVNSDILSLSERPLELRFCANQLRLYTAICAQCNCLAAHLLCKLVDERQLMYCIQNEYMPGSLRAAFHDLLYGMHLQRDCNARSLTLHEYIVPLAPQTSENPLCESESFSDTLICPPIDSLKSVRIGLIKDDNVFHSIPEMHRKRLVPPSFNLPLLKEHALSSFERIASHCFDPIRDPIGGSFSNYYVPILQLIDCLMMMGILNNAEIKNVLSLIDNSYLSKAEKPDSKFKHHGFIHANLDEPTKLQLCSLIGHAYDYEMQYVIESMILLAQDFVSKIQLDQKIRYTCLKESNLPPAVMAKKTKEFRSPAKEQMQALVRNTLSKDSSDFDVEIRDDINNLLLNFHSNIMGLLKVRKSQMTLSEVDKTTGDDQLEPSTMLIEKLISFFLHSHKYGDHDNSAGSSPSSFSESVTHVLIGWSKKYLINDPHLVRSMFKLIYRYYEGVSEIKRAIDKTYIIKESSVHDIRKLLRDVSILRSLLKVQLAAEEENLLIECLNDIIDNKVFYQHPDLIRLLAIHEKVMAIMVNRLNKRKQEQEQASADEQSLGENGIPAEMIFNRDEKFELVVTCCKLLSYYCRTSRLNQRAMFEHLSFLLDNSSMLLSRPSLRGSCPLDVACASLIDNNELALALRESHLEKIAAYLSRCGTTRNEELFSLGYHDIGWDPVEGERFLDFLKFCVWVNGDTVEENADLVIKLLIRRPDCLGPALRGEGGGLLRAIKEGIALSLFIASQQYPEEYIFKHEYDLIVEHDEIKGLADEHSKTQIKLPIEDEEYIDLGAAELTFYCTLVELLGSCAPSDEAIRMCKPNALKARSILKSLVSMNDLEGVLGLRFCLDAKAREDRDFTPGLLPSHKMSVMFFLERVYGIPDQKSYFDLLEKAFLPDIRCANVLNSLTYKFSKCRTLTKNQRDFISEFLINLTSHLKPVVMSKLLKSMLKDIPQLSEYVVVALRLLTVLYERSRKYYGSHLASEREQKLTMMLFQKIFDTLSDTKYDPELFSKALPCLTAIACSLPPDCIPAAYEEELDDTGYDEFDKPYEPKPVPLSELDPSLESMVVSIAESAHDIWAFRKMEAGWSYGETVSGKRQLHPNLKLYEHLSKTEQQKWEEPIRQALQSIPALNYKLEKTETTISRIPTKKLTKKCVKIYFMDGKANDYVPKAIDLNAITVTRDMHNLADLLAKNAHEIWAANLKKKIEESGESKVVHGNYVPYELLTSTEVQEDKKFYLEIVQLLCGKGYRVISMNVPTKRDSVKTPKKYVDHQDSLGISKIKDDKNIEHRFAYSFLSKLLTYLDKAASSMELYKKSSEFSNSDKHFSDAKDVKFFTKVILPLLEQYFKAHRSYFITKLSSSSTAGFASVKEKEMSCSLFCKLAMLLRQKFRAFGTDVYMCVRCLQVLVRSIDTSSVMKNSYEIVRASLLPFFNACGDDLNQTVVNLQQGRYSQLNGTLTRGTCSLLYLHLVSLPILASMLDHLGKNNFGSDLFVNEIAIAGFKILTSAWIIGTQSAQFAVRHRPLLGECLSAFASCFPVAFFEPEYLHNNKNAAELSSLSPEAQDIMYQATQVIPHLKSVIEEIVEFVESGADYSAAPSIIEVIVPTVCSYISFWYQKEQEKQDSGSVLSRKPLSSVSSTNADTILSAVLNLIRLNINSSDDVWMRRIAVSTLPIVSLSNSNLLQDFFNPVANAIRLKSIKVTQIENSLKHFRTGDSGEREEMENELIKGFEALIRDIYAFYPILLKYTDLHRSNWLKNEDPEAEYLYECVAEIFSLWGNSKSFKREEINYVTQNEIDFKTMLLQKLVNQLVPICDGSKFNSKHRRARRRLDKGKFSSLIVVCVRRLLPVGLNMFGGHEQELIQLAKQQMIQLKVIEDEKLEAGLNEECLILSLKADHEEQVFEFLRNVLDAQRNGEEIQNGLSWQSSLYRKMREKKMNTPLSSAKSINKILKMANVLYGLYLVDHPPIRKKGVWRKLISSQRKKAVMACFRMAPLHSIPLHRAINLFLNSYKQYWLDVEDNVQSDLIADLCLPNSTETVQMSSEEDFGTSQMVMNFDSLSQLIVCLNRAATAEDRKMIIKQDELYLEYATIMSKSINMNEDVKEDEEEREVDIKTFEEQETEKQMLLFEQERLSSRGVAETVLLYISACKGENNEMLKRTLRLGISLLHGGNKKVQKGMLVFLKETRNAGFFSSLATLIANCSVLDLDIFERTIKAESLGAYTEGIMFEENLRDVDFICSLFRFLQLLCEGHYLDFQNYLRAQTGNNTSINIIICTVDYLLSLQESMMDFYWHFSGKETMDAAGKDSFCRAITVAGQVLNTLTEYIQGPCMLNQLTLANSRLWDAISGFLYIFAHLQNKLSKDPKQIELMRELMKLQKDMAIMLLSMLEGNVLNGPIGKQMVDTLIEAQPNVEMLLQFFDIFLKMKGLTTSEAFLEFDTNKDGFISPKEFKKAMEAQKMYTEEEIDYILMCVDANQDGKVDFIEFTERFHNPAKDIGFNMAVLLTNLSEHMPHDVRLQRLMDKAKSLLSYFEPCLGRIEITGSSDRIERVYFEIKESNIEQWNKPQIKDSKKQFLNFIVNETDEKEKLEAFVNFCEDTIFEMQHAASISGEQNDDAGIAVMRIENARRLEKSSPIPFKIIIKKFIQHFKPSELKLFFHKVEKHTFIELISICVKETMFISKWIAATFIECSKVFAYCVWNMVSNETEVLQDASILRHHQPYHMKKDERELPSSFLMPELAYGSNLGNVPLSAFGINIGTDNTDGMENSTSFMNTSYNVNDILPQSGSEIDPKRIPKRPQSRHIVSTSQRATTENSENGEFKNKLMPTSMASSFDKRFKSLLARNFYKLKYSALVLAFIINFLVLFYKVSTQVIQTNSTTQIEKESIVIDPDKFYIDYILRSIAFIHSCVSFAMLIAYYLLKVPLVIFRREKEISRKLEFDGLWIVEQPSEDDLKNNWDKLVLRSPSFPGSFWNKFVKKKVRNKYMDQYDLEELNKLLGLDKTESTVSESSNENTFLYRLWVVDWRYNVWKWGVVITDRSFLYLLWYFCLSVLGNHNYFFFCLHLLDIAVSIKALSTILVSITQNGRQLLLTITLMTVVVYVYSVIAFNFFRKFYKADEDGVVIETCKDMFSCFVFHVYHGIRAGGGIGDELESPYGDPLEFYRIIFDITFFFFVVIILLAILQGLIIDAFGELREQLESVKETLESKCFICGIGQDYFNKEPHGFEIHTTKEHNFADYMFFLMHLINKPDTEHTGQESYVWDKYQNRKWEFFPVGDCFRKQYENTSEQG